MDSETGLPEEADGRRAEPPPLVTRYYGLDFFRAAMMLLGVVLHVASSYAPSGGGNGNGGGGAGNGTGNGGEGWAYHDPQTSNWAGLTLLVIHAFRMPAFFVLAGFFAAMMRERRGIWGFIRDRARRIGLVLIIAWLTLYPLVRLAFDYATRRNAGTPSAEAMSAAATDVFVSPWSDPSLAHFWFLYYLLWLYAVSLLAIAISRVVPRATVSRACATLLVGARQWLLVPLLVAATWLTLLPMRGPIIETPHTFGLNLRVLAVYAVFFGAGWAMYVYRGVIDKLQAKAWRRLGLGAIAMLAYLVLTIVWFGLAGNKASGPLLMVVTAAAQAALALAAWLMILGGMGAAERLIRRPSRIVTYLVDSAYWVYLVHLPVALIMAALLREWSAPGLVKMVAVIALVMAVVLTSYEGARGVLGRHR